MRKRRLLLAGFLLFLSVGLLASDPGVFLGKTHDQEEQERPKFYALRVVSEKNVQNAKDSLGAPDGRYAEILPGGQLVLLMEKNFVDIGTLVCKGEEDYVLEGRAHMQDTHVEQQDYAWMIINRDLSDRFDFITGRPMRGSSSWGIAVNMVRITNFGTKSLFVDAVIGYGLEAERKWEAVAFRGVKLAGGRPPVWENNNLLNIPGEMGPMKAIRRWIYATEKGPF